MSDEGKRRGRLPECLRYTAPMDGRKLPKNALRSEADATEEGKEIRRRMMDLGRELSNDGANLFVYCGLDYLTGYENMFQDESGDAQKGPIYVREYHGGLMLSQNASDCVDLGGHIIDSLIEFRVFRTKLGRKILRRAIFYLCREYVLHLFHKPLSGKELEHENNY